MTIHHDALNDPRAGYLEALAQGIAIFLPGYAVAESMTSSTSFKLLGEDGRGIIFWAGVVEVDNVLTTRLEVSGIYDLSAYISDADKPHITVGVRKGAEAIAKDVQRRFLPKYEALYAKALETHNEIERTNAARERLMADLAEWFGFKEVRDKDGHLERLETSYLQNPYPYRGKVNANYTTKLAPESERRWEVDIRLESLTVEQARRIAEVLREPAFPPEQLSLL